MYYVFLKSEINSSKKQCLTWNFEWTYILRYPHFFTCETLLAIIFDVTAKYKTLQYIKHAQIEHWRTHSSSGALEYPKLPFLYNLIQPAHKIMLDRIRRERKVEHIWHVYTICINFACYTFHIYTNCTLCWFLPAKFFASWLCLHLWFTHRCIDGSIQQREVFKFSLKTWARSCCLILLRNPQKTTGTTIAGRLFMLIVSSAPQVKVHSLHKLVNFVGVSYTALVGRNFLKRRSGRMRL